MRKMSLLFLLTILLCSCSATYYYVVRHAEKLNDTRDSPLSPAGLQRAEVLRDSLSAKGIDSIFASSYVRTQQTVQPLAEFLSKKIVIYNPDNTDSIVAVLKKIKGKKTLIAGHSDTVPAIVLGLSGNTVPAITSTDFDNLYIIKLRTGLFKKNGYGTIRTAQLQNDKFNR